MNAKLRVAHPLHKIVDRNGSWRWYQPMSRCSAPCGGLADRVLAQFAGAEASLEPLAIDGESAEIAEVIAALQEAGFLIEEREGPAEALATSAAPWRLEPAAPTFMNAPPAASEATTIGILGAGMSFGSPASVVEGPGYLRRMASSFLYQVDAGTHRPIGFYDMSNRRRILEGLTIADHGDVVVPSGHPLPAVRMALQAAAAQVLTRCRLAVAFGGDHAVTPALVASIPEPRLQVVVLDAHGDTDVGIAGAPDRAAVAADLCLMPNVERVIQIGVRGFDDPRFAAQEDDLAPKLHRLRRRHSEGIVEELSAALVPDLPAYVSIDLDVLRPQLSGGTQYVTPGGLDFDDFAEVLKHLGAATRVAGVDLVELVPELDYRGITGHAAITGLLCLLDGWWEAHREQQ